MTAQRLTVGGYRVRTPGITLPDALTAQLATYQPRTDLGRIVRACFAYLPAGLAGELLDAITRMVVIESSLGLVRLRVDGQVDDLGIVSRKVITDTGVAFLVDAWQNTTEMENLKFHGLGTGTTAEAASQTALVTELTTQYNPDNTRATGSLTEGASANIFRSVGTNTIDSGTPAVTEHAIFSQAATGGGTMWDRSVFSAVNMVAGDSLQATYDMTATSGG